MCHVLHNLLLCSFPLHKDSYGFTWTSGLLLCNFFPVLHFTERFHQDPRRHRYRGADLEWWNENVGPGQLAFLTRLEDTLHALNSISEKAEHFLLKTHIFKKSAERNLIQDLPQFLWRMGLICDGANRSWGAKSTDHPHPAQNIAKRRTPRPTPPAELAASSARRDSTWPKSALWLGYEFSTTSKSKQWNKSFKIPIWNDKHMYENHQTVNYPYQGF